ncbi:MAG: YceI family protein [Bacteroidetes bacterium]|nr:YceI family protein [Bacteroidota bacterium]
MSNAVEQNAAVETTKNWTIDVAHTNINFTVSHMVISEVTGTFKEFSGTVTAAKDDFSDAVISVTINAKSINTENNDRDNHLRSADFFDAENHPVLTFTSTAVKNNGGGKLAITGDLTMRGVTKSVVLDTKYKGQMVNPWGQIVAAFKGTTTLNRKEWGLMWNAALEAGGFLVGEEIELTLNIELNQAK